MGVLGGSWLVISGVIIKVTIVITHIKGLITLLITTHEPPSSCFTLMLRLWGCSVHAVLVELGIQGVWCFRVVDLGLQSWGFGIPMQLCYNIPQNSIALIQAPNGFVREGTFSKLGGLR